MANLDRALNIYQGYTLTKISILNKQLLAAQCAQNNEIVKLRRDLSHDLDRLNAATLKLMNLQLKEAEHNESIKFYREIAFNARECVSIIDEQNDIIEKSYLLELYASPLSLILQDARNNLEEFHDKEFCLKWETKLNEIIQQVKPFEQEYIISPLHLTLSQEASYNDAIKKVLDEIESIEKDLSLIKNSFVTPKKATTKSFVGCSVILLIFCLLVFFVNLSNNKDIASLEGISVWIVTPIIIFIFSIIYNNKRTTKVNAEKIRNIEAAEKRNCEIRKEISEAQLKLNDANSVLHEIENSHPYILAVKSVEQKYTRLKDITNTIDSIIIIEQNQKANPDFDPLFFDAARFVAKITQTSTTTLQRHFQIGYPRAKRLIEKLEEIGIVGEATENGLRPVLVQASEIEAFLLKLK